MNTGTSGTGTTQGSLGVPVPGQKADRTWPRVVLVIESVHHGNTMKVAEAMARAIDADVRRNAEENGIPNELAVPCRIVRAREATEDDVLGADVVGFGSGIYFFRHHRKLLAFVEGLPKTKGKPAFLFSTKGGGPSWWYDRALLKAMRGKGFRILGSRTWLALDTYGIWRRFAGGLNKGRPDARDLDDAGRWARKMVLKA